MGGRRNTLLRVSGSNANRRVIEAASSRLSNRRNSRTAATTSVVEGDQSGNYATFNLDLDVIENDRKGSRRGPITTHERSVGEGTSGEGDDAYGHRKSISARFSRRRGRHGTCLVRGESATRVQSCRVDVTGRMIIDERCIAGPQKESLRRRF